MNASGPTGKKPGLWILALIAIAGAVGLFAFLAQRGKVAESKQLVETTSPHQADRASLTEAAGVTTNSLAAGESNSATSTVRPAAVKSPAVADRAQHLAAQVLNAALPLRERKAAARELARLCTDQSVLALKQAVATGPPGLQTAIAAMLGKCSHPEAKTLLASLLQSPTQEVALGAVRALGTSQTIEAAWTLAGLLGDSTRNQTFRIEVANALAETQKPEALEALKRAVNQSGNEELQTQSTLLTESILSAIAKFPFGETRAFFENYLNSPQVDAEHRVAALEAMQHTPGDVGDFLLKATRDSDPDIRVAAARALVSAEERGALGGPMLSLLKETPDQEVRANLYRALAFQSDWEPGNVWPLVQAEADSPARTAGLALIAQTTRTSKDPAMASFFNQNILPELKKTALGAPDFETQMAAVMALRSAGTPEALETVKTVAAQTTNPKLSRVLNQPPTASKLRVGN